MTVKAVIFDFGDTILRNVSFNPLAGNERLLELALPGHGLKPSDVQQFANAMDREISRRKDELELIVEFPGLSFQRTLFETLGVSFSQDHATLEQEFWSASMNYEPEDGILEVLVFLRAHGIRACILSNTTFAGTVLEKELHTHGLLEYFEFVLSSCDYGFRKPNPFFYNVALARLKLTPEDVCMVGDKVEYDVIGAYKAGIRPFWYNTGDQKDSRADDCIILTHWDQFPSKLSKR
jgi:putative hydrolase of the HAD superfamily